MTGKMTGKQKKPVVKRFTTGFCFYKNPPTVCGTTRSRCETGANRACYCTRRIDLGQRIMMVPQPERRSEASVQVISNSHTSNYMPSSIARKDELRNSASFRAAFQRHDLGPKISVDFAITTPAIESQQKTATGLPNFASGNAKVMQIIVPSHFL
jgi:hypothetical protein